LPEKGEFGYISKISEGIDTLKGHKSRLFKVLKSHFIPILSIAKSKTLM